jgi:hypothetical protein
MQAHELFNKPTFVVHHDGVDVNVVISPCSWMYPNYGLQIQLSLGNQPNCGSEFVCEKGVTAVGVPMDKLTEMAEAQAHRWLKANGTAPLVAAAKRWSDAQAEFERDSVDDEKREKRRLASERSRMKKKGYTHCMEGYVHPKSGDDRFFRCYSVGEPTKDDIAKTLRASQVKDDYRVYAL